MTDVLGFPASINQINGIFSRNPIWFKKEPDPENKGSIKHKLLIGAIDYAEKLIANNDQGNSKEE